MWDEIGSRRAKGGRNSFHSDRSIHEKSDADDKCERGEIIVRGMHREFNLPHARLVNHSTPSTERDAISPRFPLEFREGKRQSEIMGGLESRRGGEIALH